MKKIIPFLSVVIFIGSIFSACSNSKTDNATSAKADSTSTQTAAAVYQCPMDCEEGKTYSEPGNCGVCGMELEKK